MYFFRLNAVRNSMDTAFLFGDPADQQDLERSQWLTNVLEKLKERWPSSFGNVNCLETAISVSYIHTNDSFFKFFRL